MKTKLVFFLLFLTKIALAQDSESDIKYLDSLGNPATKETFFKYQIFKKVSSEPDNYTLSTFNKKNQILSSFSYSDKDAIKFNGESIYYYANGNKQSLITYVDNKPIGKSFTWYENGSLKEESLYFDLPWNNSRYHKMVSYWNKKGEQTVTKGNGYIESIDEFFEEKGNYKEGYKDGKWTGKATKYTFSYEETYADGELISGVSTEENGMKNEYTSLEIRPEPKKGMEHFYKFISKKFSPTDLAYKNKVKGKILLTFVVDKEGKISDIRVLKGLGYGLDEEAIRVLSIYDDWNPALQRGRRVRCSYQIPISLDFSY